MSTAHAEAVAMGCLAAFFLLLGLLAYRLRRRTGQRNQWLYVGPAVAVVALVIMVVNLNGHAISGA